MTRKQHPPHLCCSTCNRYSGGLVQCRDCDDATKPCRVPPHAETINGGEGGAWVRVEHRTGKAK